MCSSSSNGSDLGNPVNVVYPLANPAQYPSWRSGRLADHTNLTFTSIKEMATLATQSVNVRAGATLTNGAFQFQLHGIVGESCVPQASTTLTDWLALRTNKLTSNTWTITDSHATNFQQRVYRALLAPEEARRGVGRQGQRGRSLEEVAPMFQSARSLGAALLL